jgi:hypothetical protein
MDISAFQSTEKSRKIEKTHVYEKLAEVSISFPVIAIANENGTVGLVYFLKQSVSGLAMKVVKIF